MSQLTEAERLDMINRRLKQYEIQKFNLQIDLIAFNATGDQQSITRTKNEIDKMDRASTAVQSLIENIGQKGAAPTPETIPNKEDVPRETKQE